MPKSIPVVKLLGLFLFFCLASFALFEKYKFDVGLEIQSFREQKHAEVEGVSAKLNEKMRSVYQTIRTMSLIPGVRKLDRYATRFDADAKMAIQQLYNNAYLNIRLSEVYLLPKTLDPDRVDPVTKKPEEPIATFDELVVSDRIDKKEESASAEKPEFEELEIEEYRQMKTQLEFFAKEYPFKSKIEGLEVPAISGSEVITCDNSEMSKQDFASKNDEPRKGLVITVPVYDLEGKFNGGISAVIRSKVLAELLPEGSFALVNQAHQIYFSRNPSATLKASHEFLAKGQASPQLFASGIQPLEFKDTTKWELWSAFDDNLFWASESYLNTKKVFGFSLGAVWVMFFLIAWTLVKDHRLNQSMRRNIAKLTDLSKATRDLTHQISNSSNELSKATLRTTEATHETASSIEEISSMLKQTSSSADSLNQLVQQVSGNSQNGSNLIQSVVQSAQNLKSFAEQASTRMQGLNEGLKEISNFIVEIGQKTGAINDIVFQTKLLSFNASVEAARASEHGKGFAVVAEEIGTLAKQSGDSAHQIMDTLDQGSEKIKSLVANSSSMIETFISENSSMIQSVIESAHTCQEAFESINQQIQSVQQMAGTITQATIEQSRGVEETNRAIGQISSVASQNSKENEAILDVIDHLEEESQNLDHVVGSLSRMIRIEQKDAA